MTNANHMKRSPTIKLEENPNRILTSSRRRKRIKPMSQSRSQSARPLSSIIIQAMGKNNNHYHQSPYGRKQREEKEKPKQSKALTGKRMQQSCRRALDQAVDHPPSSLLLLADHTQGKRERDVRRREEEDEKNGIREL
ncbi:hypothetical protein Dimus_039377 [Dionaea muscipula]